MQLCVGPAGGAEMACQSSCPGSTSISEAGILTLLLSNGDHFCPVWASVSCQGTRLGEHPLACGLGPVGRLSLPVTQDRERLRLAGPAAPLPLPCRRLTPRYPQGPFVSQLSHRRGSAQKTPTALQGVEGDV